MLHRSRLLVGIVSRWRLSSITMGFLSTLFTSPPNENFVCCICHDVLDTRISCRCGHTFCRDCLDEALDTDERCPISRDVIRKKDIFQNMVLSSLIGDLEISCQNNDTDAGCESTGKVTGYESHQKHDCAMQIIQCDMSECDFQGLRKDMVHVTLRARKESSRTWIVFWQKGLRRTEPRCLGREVRRGRKGK
jgi:hypothetical protein